MEKDEIKFLGFSRSTMFILICVRLGLDCNLSECFEVRHCTCHKSTQKNFNPDDNGIRISITVILFIVHKQRQQSGSQGHLWFQFLKK